MSGRHSWLSKLSDAIATRVKRALRERTTTAGESMPKVEMLEARRLLSNVSIVALSPTAHEDAGIDATFRIYRSGGDSSGSSSGSLMVNFSLQGTGDYPTSSQDLYFGTNEPPVEIPDGQDYVDVRIVANADREVEPTEQFMITLESGDYDIVTEYASANGEIVDNDVTIEVERENLTIGVTDEILVTVRDYYGSPKSDVSLAVDFFDSNLLLNPSWKDGDNVSDANGNAILLATGNLNTTRQLPGNAELWVIANQGADGEGNAQQAVGKIKAQVTNGPFTIWPGDEYTANILVTDQKGNIVKDITLNSWSTTRDFSQPGSENLSNKFFPIGTQKSNDQGVATVTMKGWKSTNGQADQWFMVDTLNKTEVTPVKVTVRNVVTTLTYSDPNWQDRLRVGQNVNVTVKVADDQGNPAQNRLLADNIVAMSNCNVTITAKTNGGVTDNAGEVTYTLTANSIQNPQAAASFRFRVSIGGEEKESQNITVFQ